MIVAQPPQVSDGRKPSPILSGNGFRLPPGTDTNLEPYRVREPRSVKKLKQLNEHPDGGNYVKHKAMEVIVIIPRSKLKNLIDDPEVLTEILVELRISCHCAWSHIEGVYISTW
jgi:hypothetical protein